MGDKKEMAAAKFAGGFNCAASVLLAFCEDYDLDEETAARIACGFGGGCAIAELCGAAAGGVLTIGLKYGQEAIEDVAAKANTHVHVAHFLELFRKENKSLICRELLGCDLTTDEGYAVYLTRRDTICPVMVKSAVGILEELGY